MKIKEREANGVTILEVSGEMYGGEDNMKLVSTLKDLASRGRLNCVIHCGKVKWISSTGLGIMVRARAQYAQSGGILRLCNLSDRVLSLFQVTKMNVLFDVHDSEKEAIAAFAGD